MIRFLASLAITMSVLACSGHAVAQPTLAVERPVAIVFEPFQSLPEGEVMMIRIETSEAEGFNGELEIKPSEAVEFEWLCGDSIRARLNGNDFRREANRFVSSVAVPENDEKTIRLRWQPENRAYIEPGRCDLLIDIALLDTNGMILIEETEVPISLQIVPDTALSIAGTSGTLNADRTFAFIDFGELETGETAFILFGAQANTDVDFTIESENGGALTSLEEISHRIPYSATFDGTPLALSSGEVVRRRPEPSLTGSRYRLDIQIGNVAGAFAGTYQDNLTVEMVAQ